MMEESRHQEGAINLSTVRDPSKEAEEQMNGEVARNGENGHDAVSQRIPGKGTPVPVLSGAAKRKSKPQVDPAAAVAAALQQTQQQQQNLLMLAAQQGLTPQQMQNLQQQLIGSSQQSLLQQQQTLMLQHQQQKLQEQALQQLHEQLQMNTLQQTQLLQQATAPSIGGSADKGKGNSKLVQQQLQSLAVQQQQLVQQIQHLQLQQRHYLLACLVQPFGMPQGIMSPAEIQQLWKEVAAQSGLEDNALKTMNGVTLPTTPSAAANGQTGHLHVPSFLTNGVFPLDGFSLPAGSQSAISLDQTGESGSSNSNNINSSSHSSSSSKTISSAASGDRTTPLYRHCLCKWPGCDTPCEDYGAFLKHLNTEHQLDDRSTAQARVQLQVVSQLEIQVTREKELLQAMMQHLHMKPPGATASSGASLAASSTGSLSVTSSSTSVPLPVPPPLPSPVKMPVEPKSDPSTPLLPKHTLLPPFTASPFIPNVTMVTSPIVPIPPPPSSQPPLLLAQPPPPSASLLSQHSALAAISSGNGCNSSNGPSISSSSCGGGPIRRRVSDKCNLPISTEIQRNREFYKTTDVRPPFTYASLIRQAIVESPHRQLTLNEIYQWFQATFAYFRRNEATWKNAVRHNLSLHKCFMRVENVKGAVWTVDEVEFYKRRPQKLSGGIKSPSLSDPGSYNETINATIRAALGDASLALMASGGQLLDQDTAQDLSIKSVAAHNHDGLVAMARSIGDEELLMSIKREAGIDLDTHTFLDGPSLPQGPPSSSEFHSGRPRHSSLSPSMPVANRSRSEEESIHTYEQQGPLAKSVGHPSITSHENEVDSDGGLLGDNGAEYDTEEGGPKRPSGPLDGEDCNGRSMPRVGEQNDYQDNSMEGEMGGREEEEKRLREEEKEEAGGRQVPLRVDLQEMESRFHGQPSHFTAMDEGAEQEDDQVEPIGMEGTQPSLEAEDDIVDNLPVFPVPQLQPVSTA